MADETQVVAPVVVESKSDDKSLSTIMSEAVGEAGISPDAEIEIDSEGGISFVNAVKGAEADAKAAKEKEALLTPELSFEDRYKEVQSAYTKSQQDNAKLTDAVNQLLQGQLALTNKLSVLEKGQTPIPEEPEVDLETLFQDKTALNAHIQNLIVKGVQAALGPDHVELGERQRIGLDLQRTMEKYSDFKEYGPELKALVDEFPDASFEKLYQAAKKLRGNNPKPASGGSATPEVKPAVTPDAIAALKAKAAAIGTESGVSGTIPNKQVVNSIRDAIGLSLAELGL